MGHKMNYSTSPINFSGNLRRKHSLSPVQDIPSALNRTLKELRSKIAEKEGVVQELCRTTLSPNFTARPHQFVEKLVNTLSSSLGSTGEKMKRFFSKNEDIFEETTLNPEALKAAIATRHAKIQALYHTTALLSSISCDPEFHQAPQAYLSGWIASHPDSEQANQKITSILQDFPQT